MGLFKNSEEKRNIMISSLLNVKSDDELFNKLTVLQNEISVGYDTKVVAVTSIKGDEITAAFSKAFADTYGLNGSKALIIDANLYNPCLTKLLNDGEDEADVEIGDSNKEYKISIINDKVQALALSKQIYPSELFKSGLIQKAINEHKDEYDHFVIIVPAIKEHKEIFLLADIIESIVLLSIRSVTTKKDIFEAIQFLKSNNLPLAKTVVLK